MTAITLVFSRRHTAGLFAGLTTTDRLRCIDRWHAAQWLKDIRQRSRSGRLGYSLQNLVVVKKS